VLRHATCGTLAVFVYKRQQTLEFVTTRTYTCNTNTNSVGTEGTQYSPQYDLRQANRMAVLDPSAVTPEPSCLFNDVLLCRQMPASSRYLL